MILITLQWYKGNFGFGLEGQVYPFDTYWKLTKINVFNCCYDRRLLNSDSKAT